MVDFVTALFLSLIGLIDVFRVSIVIALLLTVISVDRARVFIACLSGPIPRGLDAANELVAAKNGGLDLPPDDLEASQQLVE